MPRGQYLRKKRKPALTEEELISTGSDLHLLNGDREMIRTMLERELVLASTKADKIKRLLDQLPA